METTLGVFGPCERPGQGPPAILPPPPWAEWGFLADPGISSAWITRDDVILAPLLRCQLWEWSPLPCPCALIHRAALRTDTH